MRALPARAPARGGRGGQHRRRRARAGLRAGPGTGALAPVTAAAVYGLRVEREGLEDETGPSTRFVVLRSRCPAPTGRDRSFFVVTPRRDEPGSLVRLLQEFSVRGINLTTIESRPTRALLGEYRFLIECEGHVADAHVRDAVLGLLRFPGETRFLGSFPEDPARRGHAPARRAAGGRRGLRADAGAGRGVKAGVVGLGLIGGSLLRALGGAGYDADPAVREAAAAEGFEVADRLAGLAGCELVLVAVPPARTADVVGEVLDALPDAYVADTASVKGGLPRGGAARRRASDGRRRDRGLGRVVRASCSPGAPWAVCPAGDSLEPLLALAAAVDALGGRLVACTPEDHDAAVARTSHVPHVAAQALAGLAAEGGLQAALAGHRVPRHDARGARRRRAVGGDPLRQPRRVHRRGRRARRPPRASCAPRSATTRRPAPSGRWAWSGSPRSTHRRREPDWREEPVDGWSGLLAHGREGRAVRRLRIDDGALRAEVAR